jgi:predicted nuclease with TOPRIM domain
MDVSSSSSLTRTTTNTNEEKEDHDEPIHALDKYSNLQGDLEKVRQEVSSRRADVSAAHNDLQELMGRRDAMRQAIRHSQHDERMWRDKVDLVHQEVRDMTQEQDEARHRRGCAETVRTMNERRLSEMRQAVEDSTRHFHDACHRLLHCEGQDGTFLLGRSEHQQDDCCGHHEEMSTSATASASATTMEEMADNTNNNKSFPHRILQTNWFAVLSSVWSHDAAIEAREDCETGSAREPIPEEEPVRTPIPPDKDPSIEASPDHDVGHNVATANPDSIRVDKAVSPSSPPPPAAAAAATKRITDDDCKCLFDEFINRISAAQAVKDSQIAKAEAKLTKAQDRYDQMVRIRDDIQEEHEVLSTRVHRQRDNHNNIANQLTRIQKDIHDLQEQLDSAQGGHHGSTPKETGANTDRMNGSSNNNNDSGRYQTVAVFGSDCVSLLFVWQPMVKALERDLARQLHA